LHARGSSPRIEGPHCLLLLLVVWVLLLLGLGLGLHCCLHRNLGSFHSTGLLLCCFLPLQALLLLLHHLRLLSVG
jgi:hypothetical protein